MAHIHKRICSNCEKNVSWKRGNKPEKCPFCNAFYWDKPKDERELFEIQDAYRETKSQQTLGDLYIKLLTYSGNIIKYIIKNKLNNRIILSDMDLEEKSQDLATLLIEKYLKDPNFVIAHSFGGMLIKMSRGVLFKGKEEEEHSSFEDSTSEDSVVEDILYSLKPQMSTWKEYESSAVNKMEESVEDVIRVLRLFYNVVKDYLSPIDQLKFYKGIAFFAEKARNNTLVDYYDTIPIRLKRLIESSKYIVYKQLKDIQKEGSMKNNLFENPADVFEEQVNDLFASSETKKADTVVRIVSLIIYNNTQNEDLVELYDILGLDNFIKVISVFEKRRVEFPPKEEVKEAVVIGLIYYYKEIEGKTWQEIHDILPFEFDSISYSSKVKKFNNFMRSQIIEVLSKEKSK